MPSRIAWRTSSFICSSWAGVGCTSFEPGKVFAKRPPVGLNAIVIVLLLISAENGVVQRRDGFALAGDFRGNPLEDLRGKAGVDKDGEFGLSQHVDEAGSDNSAACINGARASRIMQITDGGNLSISNSDVAGIPGRAGAVDNVPVGDDDIEGRRWLASLKGSSAEEQDHGQENGVPSLKFGEFTA